MLRDRLRVEEAAVRLMCSNAARELMPPLSLLLNPHLASSTRCYTVGVSLIRRQDGITHQVTVMYKN